MKVLPNGKLVTDDGIPFGMATVQGIEEGLENGTLAPTSDGGFQSTHNSAHVCNCGCGRAISAFMDYASGGSWGATSECRKKIKSSADTVRGYLAENDLTVPGPSGGLMTTADAKRFGIKRR